MHRLALTHLIALTLSVGFAAPAVARDDANIDVSPYLITSGDPADPKFANAGANLRNGVGSIFILLEAPGEDDAGFICTASAIGPRHVLTAAHCVTEPGFTVKELLFVLNAGLPARMIIPARGFSVHPFWDLLAPFFGAVAPGDVAVIELWDDLPAQIETYDVYTGADEFGQPVRHYGHGRSGTGNKGATGDADFFYARTGLNTYEQTVEPLLGPLPPFLIGVFDQMVHDYDSGGRKHNAMEWWFTSSFACHPDNPAAPPQAQNGQCTTFKDGSYPDFKGFGKHEVGIAPGDSGGPGFIDGKIAGIHSFGFTHFCEGVTNGTDFTCGLDSSYGEMAGDTRISSYAGWIASVSAVERFQRPIPEIEPAPAGDGGVAELVELSDRNRLFLQGVEVRNLRLPVNLGASGAH